MSHSAIPHILSILTFLPLIGALIVMALPRPKDRSAAGIEANASSPADLESMEDPNRLLVNGVALVFTGMNFLLSLALFGAFQSRSLDYTGRNMQFVESSDWVRLGTLHIQYKMGVDGISLLLVLLTTFLMLLCVVFSLNTRQRLKELMVFLLFLETGLMGVFCALDLVLFYFFYESVLVPMYFLIGIFGGPQRARAALKFFVYTFAGSVLMLVAIIGVYTIGGSLDVVALSNPDSPAGIRLHGFDPQALLILFSAFSLAFLIKVPVFPFHTWLPDAYSEAPTVGTVILSGLMVKMGTYGFIRFCLPLFPVAARVMSPLFIALGIIGIIYGSLVAAAQTDAKRLIAYSSVAHLGIILLGIFTFTRVGLMGALIQNINHGISTPMLFFLVGMLYERRGTTQIQAFGGIKRITPMLATMLLIATLASIAVPFFNGFVGEFTILQGSWISSASGAWPTALAATGMILSAVYMLWWYQRIMLGPVTHPENRRLPDLSPSEWAVLIPLAAAIFWFGLGSNFWTQRMDASVAMMLPIGTESINPDLPINEKLIEERMHNERPPRHASNTLQYQPKGQELTRKSHLPFMQWGQEARGKL